VKNKLKIIVATLPLLGQVKHMKTNDMTPDEKFTYDFCIKMGDTHELAMKSIEIMRARPDNHNEYRLAYEA
jgi:hypothetical protein